MDKKPNILDFIVTEFRQGAVETFNRNKKALTIYGTIAAIGFAILGVKSIAEHSAPTTACAPTQHTHMNKIGKNLGWNATPSPGK